MEIRGPSNLQILEVDDRKFFLFGDIHNSLDTTCSNNAIQIDELLTNILSTYENNGIPCDVFLELSYTKESTRRFQNEVSYLKITTNRFRDCLTTFKNQCLYKNIRFHYSDIRSVITMKGEEATSVIGILSEIDTMMDIALVANEILSNIPHYANIELSSQNYIDDVKRSKIFQLNVSQKSKQKIDRVLLTSKIIASKIDGRIMSRVAKNLYKLETKIRNQLYSFILQRILHFARPDAALIDDLKNQEIEEKILNIRCQRLKMKCMRISALLMDCYTISRMLQQKDRVIAYLGKYHIDTIHDFFTQYPDTKILENVDSGKDRCIKSQYLMNEI